MRTLSSLQGREVETESGRGIGRCYDLRAEQRGTKLVVTHIVVGLRGLLEHFGLARARPEPCSVTWDAVVRIEGSRIVVRDGTELE